MIVQPTRIDPADRYFKAVQNSDACSNTLFWVAASLSFAVLFVEKEPHTVLYQVVEIAFAVAVVLLFIIGMAQRLYWMPRAEDQRRLGFFSNSFDTALTHEKSEGYYNNPETEPLRRVGLSLMENSFFTRAVALEMLKGVRIFAAIYLALFLVAVLNRNTNLALIAVASQAVFSEQLISRWLRLEWLSGRCGNIYMRLYDLFHAPPAARTRNARILDALTTYETTKANAGISLSSRIFFKMNPSLTAEWDKIIAALKQDQPYAGK